MVKFKRYLFSEIPIPRTTAYRYKRRKRSPLRDTKQVSVNDPCMYLPMWNAALVFMCHNFHLIGGRPRSWNTEHKRNEYRLLTMP